MKTPNVSRIRHLAQEILRETDVYNPPITKRWKVAYKSPNTSDIHISIRYYSGREEFDSQFFGLCEFVGIIPALEEPR